MGSHKVGSDLALDDAMEGKIKIGDGSHCDPSP